MVRVPATDRSARPARFTTHAAPTAAAVLLMLALQSGTAGAQAVRACAPPDMLVQKLGQEFGEQLSAQGVDGEGNLVQVFSSSDGTWTIAVTIPGGPSCIVSSGEGWDDSRIAEVPKPVPAPDYAS
ncbi:MAG: hypothetical protein RLO51_18810 [Thalassobaculum sp.]|uniref:hypothetical protein n=1 Tax=Thalassobaculum sp. TaxID=2022740 RepID=UPI0032EDF79C